MKAATEKNPRRSRRLAFCHTCKHAEKHALMGVTCGPALVGAHVQHEGQEVHLCGCVMALKTMVPSATCPIGRW